jgi:hypothetical protein
LAGASQANKQFPVTTLVTSDTSKKAAFLVWKLAFFHIPFNLIYPFLSSTSSQTASSEQFGHKPIIKTPTTMPVLSRVLSIVLRVAELAFAAVSRARSMHLKLS